MVKCYDCGKELSGKLAICNECWEKRNEKLNTLLGTCIICGKKISEYIFCKSHWDEREATAFTDSVDKKVYFHIEIPIILKIGYSFKCVHCNKKIKITKEMLKVLVDWKEDYDFDCECGVEYWIRSWI